MLSSVRTLTKRLSSISAKTPAIADESYNNYYRVFLIYGFLVHILMFLYDSFHPDVFLNVDRSLQRIRAIETFTSMSLTYENIVNLLTSYGIVGDYLFHLIVFWFFGQYGIIITQVFLLFISLHCIYKSTFTITKSRKTSLYVVIIYFHLPHSLVFAHQLSSEAIFTPLVIVSFNSLVSFVYTREKNVCFLSSGVLIGLATFIRPVTILWPVITVGIFLVSSPRVPFRYLVYYLIGGLFPLLFWMTCMAIFTGQFAMGSSNHDVPHNLTFRFEVMINKLPAEKQIDLKKQYLTATDGKRPLITPSGYAKFSVMHFDLYLKHLFRDMIVTVAKSGINRLVLDYFDADQELKIEFRREWGGWRNVLKQKGFWGTIKYVYGKNANLLLINVIFSTIFLIAMFLFFVGLILFLQDRSIPAPIKWSYGLFPFYIFGASQVVKRIQSRHRFPYEFIVCFLVVFSLEKISAWYNARKSEYGSDRLPIRA